MFGLVITLAALGQAPEYIANYRPKVGDKIVLARDEAGRKVPVAKTDGAALGFKDIIEESDSHYDAIVGSSDELTEIDGGPPARIVENVKYLHDAVNPICEKHKADFKEVNGIATGAGVLIMLDGEKYDIAGNRMRK
jgi:hypothetical protein